jgi:hypothetical protein
VIQTNTNIIRCCVSLHAVALSNDVMMYVLFGMTDYLTDSSLELHKKHALPGQPCCDWSDELQLPGTHNTGLGQISTMLPPWRRLQLPRKWPATLASDKVSPFFQYGDNANYLGSGTHNTDLGQVRPCLQHGEEFLSLRSPTSGITFQPTLPTFWFRLESRLS